MHDADQQYMQQALALAARGAFGTPPNPNVGCVIVRDGQVVGRGWHERPGEPHAEVHALREAAELAQGATAYVTLEPCSHHGRTPPCADALIKAQVARVVVAMRDPNPLVAGQGIARLEAAGIKVHVGVLEQQARTLNQGFIARMERNRPWLRLKMAMSVDGRTALANGASQWLTSREAREDVHRFRAQSGAVLTTARTVLMDHALMTARHPQAERQPLRVLLDRQQQVPVEHPFFAQASPVLRVVSPTTTAVSDWPEHVQTLEVQSFQQRLPLHDIFAKLAEYDVNDVWTECGAQLAGALTSAGLVDEWVLYVAPKLLGDSSRGVVQLPNFHHLDQVPEMRFESVTMLGHDLRICARPLHASDRPTTGEVQS
ncbi:bifunctional diaminohydroxyphosphoribosylaminopyrimidine deaminase/5-amino-6-(5-phosphoribosylamino)uracil reductase RibD [Pseudidiomarina sediminum]|uniref:bifunctional diaminohydroxyphosphoribosylaminopyrimidine deaminase/5-amino-6-(5-phosphoribosylamino)uracil reductase RibD n=1 Tax=Pseudidiomarina sediminum TaxID=431675 RepID=UPI001C949B58|nr:bifunctional diaminohydroxyphosphoribosylaminopyrimidine deaminase/5-amino-6-(5-phosphoribosylamino)uracil reductase RibD [Pseudidiomarina sediminum]MBY6063388.1 bifunctional diaminohydroxyphosphoribosylaminopyrimidine deaminase/5-amino-6-(5-phosphoribosylamino)uracil reductase RibD [Pseudidiomarina sediminum]